MRLAIPIFKSRISPVFDFSTKALIIQIEQGRETDRSEIDLAGLPPQARVEKLKRAGVNSLVCASISLPLQEMLIIAGLNVISGIVGAVDEVLKAYQRGNLKERRFMMPGLCRRCRKRRGSLGGHGQ
jgi:predicted Fe-Mo cluster-binding NifX family protein